MLTSHTHKLEHVIERNNHRMPPVTDLLLLGLAGQKAINLAIVSARAFVAVHIEICVIHILARLQ